MNRWTHLFFLIPFVLSSCSADKQSGRLVYDTSFQGHFYGNVYRDESRVPEGFIDYARYFKYAKAYFYLDGTCKFLMSEKSNDGTYFESEEVGTYFATAPYSGGGFDVHYTSGRIAKYRWEANWHDSSSTPFELSERRTITLKATGETVDIVFSYLSDYTSEM